MAKAATAAFAPWADPEWEIWGLPWVTYPGRVDRYFEIHSRQVFDAATGAYGKEEWIYNTNAMDTPVYCHRSRLLEFAHAVEYPLAEVRKTLPFTYLENSVAYQIALAIHERRPAIGLYGVHMTGGAEYVWERPSVTYLVGLAQGRGIEVIVAPGSPLFMSRSVAGVYGDSPELRF